MAVDIVFDMGNVPDNMRKLTSAVVGATKKAMLDVANEVLRLSTFEVPHDTGMLQSTGHVEPGEGEVLVGYNKVYAARLHEHPEYRYQKGRKGKYLEDPIKNNTDTFLEYYKNAIGSIII